jgi:hypothetical protein
VDKEDEGYQKTTLTGEDLLRMPATLYLAQEMGKSLA